MFGNSVRSVSTPIRGYVCSSCLARKNVGFPIRRQAVRFASAGVAHSDPGKSASDPVLCAIGGQSEKANEDCPATSESTPSATAEIEKGGHAALTNETEESGDTEGLVRRVNSRRDGYPTKREKASPKAQDLSEAATAVKKPTPKKAAADAPKKLEEADPSTFVKTLKSLRARKAANPRSKGDGKGPGKKREGARRSLETNSIDAKDLKIFREYLPGLQSLESPFF